MFISSLFFFDTYQCVWLDYTAVYLIFTLAIKLFLRVVVIYVTINNIKMVLGSSVVRIRLFNHSDFIAVIVIHWYLNCRIFFI